MRTIFFVWLTFLLSQSLLIGEGTLFITEFMAANSGGLRDQDGDSSDWIEVFNACTAPVDLAGWHLTDDSAELIKWTFPSTNLAPGQYLVVFASGKDRAVAGAELHANFQLDSTGEYLALVRPDGLSVAHQFGPSFPPQETGIAYGIILGQVTTNRFATNGQAIKWTVPSSAGFLPANAAVTNFDDSAWADGMTGFGFDVGTNFDGLIRTDAEASMRGRNASAFFRLPFIYDTEETPAAEILLLGMRYDDGFIAYLNGVEIARRNAPELALWNSSATAEHANAAALVLEQIGVADALPLLQEGTNVLAFHVMNLAVDDGDLLLVPELAGIAAPLVTERYFPAPTPGQSNSTAYTGLVADAEFSPARGFYDAPISVSITSATPGITIRYTLNNSIPSITNGLIYTAPIDVSKTTTIRAAAFRSGYQPTDVDTHTYIFVDDVVGQPEMDRNVIGPGDVFGGKYAATIRADLKAIPSLSVVMDPPDLIGTNGIYSNSTRSGLAWERRTSIEVLFPDGTPGEQVNGGIRIHGNAGRSPNYLKFSFRLLFKEIYGTSRWRYPIFGSIPGVTDSFDDLVLRANTQDGWIGGGTTALYLRDAFARETLLEMGGTASHHRFFHLYLNGTYWGLYELVERPDASFSSGYFGGEKDSWDAITVGTIINSFYRATSGDLNSWNSLLDLCRAGLGSLTNYMRVQGRNADGTVNTNYPNYLDVENMIDYMIMHFYIGIFDWPVNNYWIGRERTPTSTGFKFYPWDAELSLLDVSANVTFAGTGVAAPHGACLANPEFRVLFGDHVQRHFFNGGALCVDPQNPHWDPAHPERNVPAERLTRLCDSIHQAIVGESARWGNHTRDADWAAQKANLLNNYFPQRNAVVLNQLRTANLFPNISAPKFNQYGGSVPAGFSLVMTNDSTNGGTIFYTFNGGDPRLAGGAINPAALSYAAPEVLNATVDVRARLFFAGAWSALTRATFYVSQDFSRLLVSEIMYHPMELGGDNPEFLELKNAGVVPLDLSGLRFTSGIEFTFPNGTVLLPGAFFVLARDPGQFAARYPQVAINGLYAGKLDDGGETLRLVHALGSTLLSVTYQDRAPWSLAPDGFGFSLVPTNPNTNPDPDAAANWRASAASSGSPGADDPPSSITPIFINEILAAAAFPDRDAIELFNPASHDVNIGGWFLSDDRNGPGKFRLPLDTTIPAGGFFLLDATQFNAAPGAPGNFSFDADGDEVCLLSADTAGNFTGYSHSFSFGASDWGVTLGRYVKSTGAEEFVAQSTATLGGTNASPRVGPVVINEIMYHPEAGSDEFIELRNIMSEPVALFDSAAPAGTWRLDGLGFDFPSQVTLNSNGLLLLVSIDPEIFRHKYAVPLLVPILRPYSGQLQDSGERLALQKPRVGGIDPVFVDVDVVRYNDRAPWPPAADGGGPSLQRRLAGAYGDDPINWEAAAPTPGRLFAGGSPPRITTAPVSLTVVATREALFAVGVEGPGPILYQWRFNGSAITHATSATLLISNLQAFHAGRYTAVVFNDGGAVETAAATLTVLTPANIVTQPVNVSVRIPPDPRAAATTNVTFTVAANSGSPVRYQWRFNGVEINGATNESLTITNVQLGHEGDYSAAITDDNGTIFSAAARLQPLITPTFTQHPISQSIVAGGQVALSAAIAGHPPPFSYVWRRGSALLVTNSVMDTQNFFNFTASTAVGAQNYSVVVKNLANSQPGVLSSTALVTTMPDADGDGLPDEWEIQVGLNPNANFDRQLDTDGDGMSNWQEYMAGTDPINVFSYLKVELNTASNIATVRFGAVANKTYTIQCNDSGFSGAWSKLGDVLARTDNRLEIFIDPWWRSNRFYRIATPQQR